MKIKIKKEIEMDVEFPIYYDYGGVNKIVSPDCYIEALVSGGSFRVGKHKNCACVVESIIMYGTPITEEEFKEGYRKAMSHVVHEGFLQASEPATTEEIRESIYDDEPVNNMQLCDALNDEE